MNWESYVQSISGSQVNDSSEVCQLSRHLPLFCLKLSSQFSPLLVLADAGDTLEQLSFSMSQEPAVLGHDGS